MKYVHFHLVLAAAVMLICSGGCSRARWLSRKDYKELNDPFAAGSEMADAESSENSEFEADPATAGRASLAEPKTAALPWQRPDAGQDTASTAEPAAAEPKPIIQQASGNSFDTNAGSVAQASYPDETPESLDESPQPAAFDPLADAPADVHTIAAAISSGDSAEELPELPAIADGESEHPFEAAEALAAEARQTNSVPASQETLSADAFSATVTNDAVNEHQGDAAAADAFSDSDDQTAADDQPVNPFSLDRQPVSGSPAEDFAADVGVNSRTPAPAQSSDILPDDQWSTDLNGMSDDIAQPLIPAIKPGAQPSRNQNPFGDIPKATGSPSVSSFSSKIPVWPATGLKQNTVPSAVPKPGVGQKPKKAAVNPFYDELPSGDSDSGHSLPDFGSTDTSTDAELPPDFESAESGDSDADHGSKLDAGFDMDSGWKPSHAVKP
jgi:hypothetical protein